MKLQSPKTETKTESLVRRLREIKFPTGLEAADALEEMQRNIDTLAKALDIHGKHYDNCAYFDRCTCGLDSALALLKDSHD